MITGANIQNPNSGSINKLSNHLITVFSFHEIIGISVLVGNKFN
jgi:hypothetical protein